MGPSSEHPLVFFTGGTALRELSRCLASRTKDVVHVITPFDSGGSTKVLRTAFGMPAVGDIRNRLLALADTQKCPAGLIELLASRLPCDADQESLRRELKNWDAMRQPFPEAIQRFLKSCCASFLSAMPENFDLRGACLGNLFLAGIYFKEGRSLSSMISIASRLVQARGTVLAVVEESLHLAALLVDGSLLVGQHRFKELHTPVQRLFLTVHEPREGVRPQTECHPLASRAVLTRLRTASLICYPMGSFYTSVLANLLPSGIGKGIANRHCPKVFIPNTGHDAELLGISLEDEIDILLASLHEDAPQAQARDFLSLVCVDTKNGFYSADMPRLKAKLERLGIGFFDREIVQANGQFHNAEKTADLLLQLCED